MTLALRGLFIGLLVSALPTVAPAAAAEPPPWAYPVNPPGFTPAPDDGSIRRVPGSSVGYTLSQVRDLFSAPDWHPQDHPKMPEIVATGRKPDVFACGFCHRAEGTGGPENANIAGLPYGYILQQMADYKSGARKTALPERVPQKFMMAVARSVTDDEVKAAAKYFAALKPKANLRVVEAAMVPESFVANWFYADMKNGKTEPLGRRILEVPEDLEHFESRDTRSTFVAYVPVGSIKRGEELVEGRSDKAPACAACHGADLKGDDVFPPIAGRSPSYMFRQLYEFKSGVRAGRAASKMRPSVKLLDEDDMIAIAAYLATRQP